jgi:hypothetical protein
MPCDDHANAHARACISLFLNRPQGSEASLGHTHFYQNKKELVPYTMIDVWHKIILKRSLQKKEKFLLIFAEIV